MVSSMLHVMALRKEFNTYWVTPVCQALYEILYVYDLIKTHILMRLLHYPHERTEFQGNYLPAVTWSMSVQSQSPCPCKTLCS